MTSIKFNKRWPPKRIIDAWINENFPETIWYWEGVRVGSHSIGYTESARILFADPSVATWFIMRWS